MLYQRTLTSEFGRLLPVTSGHHRTPSMHLLRHLIDAGTSASRGLSHKTQQLQWWHWKQ